MTDTTTPRKKPQKFSNWEQIEDRIGSKTTLDSLHYIEDNWEGEDLKEQKKHFYNTYFNQERIHKSFDLTPADKAAIETFKTEILPQLDGWKDSLGDEQQKQEMRRVITTLNNSLLSLDKQWEELTNFLNKYPASNAIINDYVGRWRNINDARGASVKFRTSQEVKMEEDPETYMQAKMAVDAFRFNPSLHYSENCRNKIHFLKEELKISSNEDLILQRMHGCNNLSEAWIRSLDLPTSTKFTEDMKAIKGFKSFLEEIKNYLITVKFYQAGGAVVPQQFYLLLGPPGVGKSYISWLIAKALGKQFININCASAKISELIGIAQDYTGKDFGKIVKRMIEGKDRAPVILFDEIDKCSDKEILNTISIIFDDTKNKTDFEDVYFQFPVPMNECFMICTANYLERLEQFVLSRCTRVKIEWLTYEDRIEVAKKELFNALKESKSGIEKYADENGPDYKFTDKFFHRTLVEEWGVRGIKNNIKSMIKKLISKCVEETGTSAKFEPTKLGTLGNLDDYDWGFRYYREYGQRDEAGGRRVFTCLAGIKQWKSEEQLKAWQEEPTDEEEKKRRRNYTLHEKGCECFVPFRIKGWRRGFYTHEEKYKPDDGESWKPTEWKPEDDGLESSNPDDVKLDKEYWKNV